MCRVPNTRCPVSAAVIAVLMVSLSLSSPTRITSGSCRRLSRSPSWNDPNDFPSSRWLTSPSPFLGNLNSMGSSRVITWRADSFIIDDRRAAKVVDLPDPVGPVISTIPRSRCFSSAITRGRFISSGVGIFEGSLRNAPVSPWASLAMFTLNLLFPKV